MNHNPFMPREQRTAILTFDNGQRVRAEILIPQVRPTNLSRRPRTTLHPRLPQVAASGCTQVSQSAYPAQLISEHIKTVKTTEL